jgi:hypothetical protein
VAVFGGLILVQAHHIPARILDPDLFHLQRRWIVPVVALAPPLTGRSEEGGLDELLEFF